MLIGKSVRSAAVCAACLAALPALARAEDQGPRPAEASRGAPEIVVTAQRRDEDPRDVPMSLAVHGRADLADYRIATAERLVERTPGFTLARSFRGAPIFTLRGVGFNTANMSASSPVGFAQDDMTLAYPVLTEGLLFDLARVEVAKGPQGTLFGRNTTGGLVRLISAQPTDDPEGYLTLRGGGYRSYGAEGALSGPLGAGFSARIAVSARRADEGWQTSIRRDDRLGREDRTALRAILRWAPSADASVSVTANWWRDGSDTQAPQSVEMVPQGLIALGLGPADWAAGAAQLGLPADFMDQSFSPRSAGQADWASAPLPWPAGATPAPLHFRNDNDFRSLSVKAAIGLAPGLTLEAQAHHLILHRASVTDNSGWAYENAITSGRGRIASDSGELRIVGSGARVDWTVGAIRTVDRVSDADQSWNGTNSLLQLFRVTAAQAAAAGGADAATQAAALYGFRDYLNSTRQTVRSFAVYGQARYRLAPGLGLTFGLRHTRDRTSVAGCSRDSGDGSLAATMNAYYTYAATGLTSAVAPGGCTTFLADLSQGLVEDRLAEDNLSGRLAVDWRPAAGVLVYGSVARGFKAGTFPNIEGNFAVQYTPARQEELWSWEAGVKAEPLSWLTVDTAAFYSRYRDKQLFGAIADPIFGALNRVLNVPRSHVWGAEARVEAQPAGRLRIDGSVSFVRTRIDDYIGLDDDFAPRDFAGARFPYAPELQFVINARQGIALPGAWEGSAELTYRYTGPQWGEVSTDPRYRIKPAGMIDLGLALASPGAAWRLSLFIRNLTDRYTWNAVHRPSDSFLRYAAMPRTWDLALTRTF